MKHTLNVNREVTVTKIIIGGKLRSGKDTAAKHMWLSHNFQRYAFADKVKDVAHDLFPEIPREPKPRKLYVDVGEKGVEIDPLVWVKHVERQIDNHVQIMAELGLTEVNVVITDLRKQAEYDWARANGFTIIRVTAPDEVRISRAIAAGDDFCENDLEHETELAIDGFAVDYTVENNGSVDELKRKIDEIMEAIG
jgi:dephospho-CoA kinase